MNTILSIGLLAAALFAGTVATSANAMPVQARQEAAVSELSGMPIVEVRSRHGRVAKRQTNRGHHYGWQRGRHNPHRR